MGKVDRQDHHLARRYPRNRPDGPSWTYGGHALGCRYPRNHAPGQLTPTLPGTPPRSRTRPLSGPPDPVDRDFVAAAPNRCWMADFTRLAIWAGTGYLAFVIDTFSRRTLGWSAATTNPTELVLAAVEDESVAARSGTQKTAARNSPSITATRAAGTPRSSSPPTWTARASWRPSARSATPTTTP
ncbi:DDE-type integrase/transposase/recombinase [Streptomyces sp. SLBN-118]|uniref:DDE-type integrase/transposase/recombinase n=1 Tax=Streptomyces sp. SLBN-118 TaxID=2768454 RepID=UPI0011503E8E